MTEIWGIGNRTAARLGELGIVTVEDLARADHELLARHFGPTIGPHLRILGLGGDDAPLVDEPHVAKGRSREETFTTDVADPAAMAEHVGRLAREVTESVVAEGRRVTHVAVKVRTATFCTRTKISKLPAPTTERRRGRGEGRRRAASGSASSGRSASSACASCSSPV